MRIVLKKVITKEAVETQGLKTALGRDRDRKTGAYRVAWFPNSTHSPL